MNEQLVAKNTEIARYGQRMKVYQWNRLFRADHERYCEDINENCTEEMLIPDNVISEHFWSDICIKEKKHKKDADWLQKLELVCSKQRELSALSSWVALGPDEVQKY